MLNKNFALICTLFLTTSLIGCQSLGTNSERQDLKQQLAQQKVTWEKRGRIFDSSNDIALGTNQSRVVLFRDSKDGQQNMPIYFEIGADNMFQASLKSNYYSDVVVCSGQQKIKIASLIMDNEKVSSLSDIYSLPPQETTYFKASLSATNQPILEQVTPQYAIAKLATMPRQSYQISRVSMVCDTELTRTKQPGLKDIDERAEKPMLYSVNFNHDTDIILDNNYSKLEELANFINAYPKAEVVLEGHTDNVGSESYNLKLSKARAEKVKSILVNSYAIDSERLRTIGYGEAKPIDTNKTEVGRLNNRRVVAVLSQ